jgi:hypothetical protein
MVGRLHWCLIRLRQQKHGLPYCGKCFLEIFFENVNETERLGEKYAMEVFRDVGSESVKQEV